MGFGLRRLFGVSAVLAMLPFTLGSQPPANKKAPPVNLEVGALKVNGVHAVKLPELLKNITTSPNHCISLIFTPFCAISKSKFFFKREHYNPAELKRDVLRIRVFYYKRGYRETTVDTLVTQPETDEVAITLNIVEGPPTLVSSLDVVQSRQVLTPAELKKRVVLMAGMPLNILSLDSTKVFLEQSLWNKGYADAVVEPMTDVDTTAHTASIKINVDPKWKATIGDILIEGENQITERTIRKSLTMTVGGLFRRAEVLKSQRALYESNLFRRASIEVPKQGDSSKVIVVTVQEAPLREARLSAGFNTIDFFQAEGRYTHYNFFGGARRLELSGAVGNLFSGSLNGRGIFRNVTTNIGSDRSRYFTPTYNASVNLRQPWFGSHANELATGVFAHRRSAPGIYVDRGFGTTTTFTRVVADRAPASANYTFELAKVDAGDVYFCVNYGVCDNPTLTALRGQHRLSPFTITSSLERTNDPFEPTHGTRATLELEHASSFTLSDFHYNRASVDAAVFRPFRKRGALGTHVRLGWVHALASTGQAIGIGTDTDLLHPRKRFYSGGSRSVRGYGENQLGPRILTVPASTLRRGATGCPESTPITACDPNSVLLKDRDFEPRPLGGNIVAEGSVELRFPVWQDKVFGATFVDAGYVAQRINPTLPRSKAAITPGFGIRYLSPVGPIRVDFGINPGLSETLPVVTETVVNGTTQLVKLDKLRVYHPVRGGFNGVLDRLTLHLSIGEAF
ncbi:MAG: BamA/TamA family outer membrane protein [Gemmatimonadales bacterium]